MTPISNELFQACQKWANEPNTRRSVDINLDGRIPEASIFVYDYDARYGTNVTDKSQLPNLGKLQQLKREELQRELEELEK